MQRKDEGKKESEKRGKGIWKKYKEAKAVSKKIAKIEVLIKEPFSIKQILEIQANKKRSSEKMFNPYFQLADFIHVIN